MSDPTTTICGNLGADPELRFLADGTPVANMSVAVSRYRGPDKEAATDWYRVTVWRDQAENVGESLSKGDRVLVFGKLLSRVVEDEDGGKRTYWDLQAEHIGPELRFATATVTKTNPTGHQAASAPAYQLEEEPF